MERGEKGERPLVSRHVSWFADIALSDRADVGGKGGSLGELQRAGVAVPPGFVVRTAAFDHFMTALERVAPVRMPVRPAASMTASGVRSPIAIASPR